MSTSISAFSALSFIGFVVSPIPFYWHLQAANVGTCLYMFWSSIGCLNLFINSCIWNGNTKNSAPVWCDISTRVIIAENVAMPASILCITRQLYLLTGLTSGAVINKRRETIFGLTVGLAVPILQVVLSYIVQGNRFDIIEDVGCWPALVNTHLTYILVLSWPLIIATASASFGLCALYRFVAHRRDLRSLPSLNDSGTRYIRLTILASCDIFGTIPMCIYTIYYNTRSIEPWASWKTIHAGFSTVYVDPASLWKASASFRTGFEITQWSTVYCALAFFLLFGTISQEAVEHYQSAYRRVRSSVGRLAPGISARTSTSTLSPTADVESLEGKPRVAVFDPSQSTFAASVLLDTVEKEPADKTTLS
ncbi:STE3-domain-containing protein [Artomyces pyxidatus]|uniref:STE3-domain-containing protein n=1 Tax=Artomyces pyxidatus TaxID=48021 RepID=A0ACB8SYF6_9AGAM|nr:STE3-domain-containing protein [Artomyces pyxidatus]